MAKSEKYHIESVKKNNPLVIYAMDLFPSLELLFGLSIAFNPSKAIILD